MTKRRRKVFVRIFLPASYQKGSETPMKFHMNNLNLRNTKSRDIYLNRGTQYLFLSSFAPDFKIISIVPLGSQGFDNVLCYLHRLSFIYLFVKASILPFSNQALCLNLFHSPQLLTSFYLPKQILY